MMISFNTAPSSASSAAPSPVAAGNAAPSQAGALPQFAQQLAHMAAPAAPASTAAMPPLPADPLGMALPRAAAGQPAAHDGEQATDVQEPAHAQLPGAESLLAAMAPPVMTPPLPVQTEPVAANDASAAATAPAAPTAAAVAPAAAAMAAAQQLAAALPAGPALPQAGQAGLRAVALQFNLRGADTAARDARAPLAAVDASAAKFSLNADTAAAMPAPAAAAPGSAPRDGERSGSNSATPAANALLQPLAAAAGTPAGAGSDTLKLNGAPQQWQQPLREALGERLQTQIGRNGEHAVIRLDPPMLGRIEISIRHTAGSLQVSVNASNSEVLRQLQGIGETMRTDLAQRQYTDVAVTIGATARSPAAQAYAEGDGRGQRQPGRQQDDNEPGRALSDGTAGATTFAMHERDYN